MTEASKLTKAEAAMLSFCLSQMADLSDEEWRQHGFRQSTHTSLVNKVAGSRATPAPSQPEGQEDESVAWRTSWAVLQRLAQAATEPPSLSDHRNTLRPDGDLWRTVLLSDLQELLAHGGVKLPKTPSMKERGDYRGWWSEHLSSKKAGAAAPAEGAAWQPVSEGLPKEDGLLCVVLDPTNEPTVWPAKWSAEYQTFQSNGGWFEADEATHWMPLPAALKEKP